MMISIDTTVEHDWLSHVLESLKYTGAAILTNVLDSCFLETTREKMYRARDWCERNVGKSKLDRAGELGVLRMMFASDRHFFRFLELPEVLAVVDNTVSSTAILHLQNGFILPSQPSKTTPSVFQHRFHMDFPRVLSGFMASINVFFAIDTFTEANGGTLIVPGTHQQLEPPDPRYLKRAAIPVECPAGSMLVFDSTLWHAAGQNTSGQDRLGINHQFTRSYIKQQIDYVRALGEEAILQQTSRTQQLLGWYTRVVTSLDEYYLPPEERLYRSGQG